MNRRIVRFVVVLAAGWAIASATAQDKSVKPGINKPFESPNPGEFVERFEREGRDVYDKRHEIVAACRVKPAQAIADIGAGTGLFTRLFAEATGPEGKVYAVDIAPEFIDHIQKTAAERGLQNVNGVVCKPDSVELPPDSIDLAFICDTYHHFEFPEKTLESIRQALRPGGRLIVVDFDRIEGVSSDWILNHVRADKQTFADEIVRAGFRFDSEEELMKDTYFLRFEETAERQPGASAKLHSHPLRGKRVIEWGWDEPDTRFMRENIDRMEQLPFDGVVFHVGSSKGGNFVWEMWSDRKFTADEFAHAVVDLKATPFRRLTDLFLRVNVTPGTVDWFDDAGWSIVLENFAIAAQVARDGNTKGFMFDVEQYNSALFDYRQQKDREGKTFDEYKDQVRKRGKEWMGRVNKEFPDITILLSFGYKLAQPRSGQKDRSESRYGLLADFLDGMVESCNPRTTIVDAWEFSYPYKEREQFVQAYDTIRQKSAEWSATPERYKQFVRAGFGIWMDYNWRRFGWNEQDFSKNHFTPQQFQAAVRAALETTDSYVWVYTEQPRWWTDEKLPQEYVDALRKAQQRE